MTTTTAVEAAGGAEVPEVLAAPVATAAAAQAVAAPLEAGNKNCIQKQAPRKVSSEGLIHLNGFL